MGAVSMFPTRNREGAREREVSCVCFICRFFSLELLTSGPFLFVPFPMSFTLVMAHKQEVLKLYKDILRLSRTWNAKVPQETMKERSYIEAEARSCFKSHKSLANGDEIRKKIDEGWKRVEVAKHYGIPYPRPVYFGVGTVTNIEKKRQKKRDLSVKK